MRDVKVSAKAADAREATGFSLIQWRRFLAITRVEADNYVEAHPQYSSWVALPADQQNALWASINVRLDAERIPRINQSVLIWRMSQAMREARRLYVMSHGGEMPAEADAEVQPYQSPYQPVRSPGEASGTQGYGSPYAQPQAQTGRAPYDPVKEAANTPGGSWGERRG